MVALIFRTPSWDAWACTQACSEGAAHWLFSFLGFSSGIPGHAFKLLVGEQYNVCGIHLNVQVVALGVDECIATGRMCCTPNF